MLVKDLIHVTPIYVSIVYIDRITKEIIDYKNMHRKERDVFRNRTVYIIEPYQNKINCYLY